MEIISKSNFDDFEPWSGAKDTWEELKNYDRIGTLEAVLEDMYPDGIDETTLNDILWFEEEEVYEWVGLYYSSASDVVSDEPLCGCCGEQIPEVECKECFEMVCTKCVVKCSVCGRQICKECVCEECEQHDNVFCEECYEKQHEAK